MRSMKSKVVLCLALLLSTFTVLAGTVSAKPIIKADKTYYDVDTGVYILSGNVYVGVGDRIITAGQAKASLGSMEVWGSNGITLSQGDIYLKADSVYVIGSQNKAVIEGSVTFARSNLTVVADKAEFDWKTKLGVFSGNVQVHQAERGWQGAYATYNAVTGELTTGY